ncbi:MAG: acyl-CoA thioesterase/BAAT N-terminal domain-containing protein [Actinobacteria bacterium]|nr:acyl-CoA thioesterase/BAAT N-terminal domain-containing protein [Actinomycetota bacterium]
MKAGKGFSERPRIEITPESSLADEALQIRLTGFKPRQRVTLRASLLDDGGGMWESHAVFTCGTEGGLDLSQAKPVSGTYREADAMGLFWSMTPRDKKDAGAYVKVNADPKQVAFTAEADGYTMLSKEIERFYTAPGVERIPVDEDGIIGTYFKPQAEGPHPAVIVMHGTANRIMEDRGSLLASRGYAVLSLLYFGGEGLPGEYIRIPVEYFETCIDWLSARPEVKEGGVALIGVSRGGEGALVVASRLHKVNAVVSISGGGVVFEGLHKNPREGGPETPWTWRGDDVPFAQRKDSFSFTARAIWSGMSKKPLSTLSTYIEGMKDAEAVKAATIEVEKIEGSVLLVSGREDRVWPSSELSRIALARLEKNDHPFPCKHLDYDGAGHVVFLPYQPTTVGYTRVFSGMALDFGGNPGANARASVDSWEKMLRFLADNLG